MKAMKQNKPISSFNFWFIYWERYELLNIFLFNGRLLRRSLYQLFVPLFICFTYVLCHSECSRNAWLLLVSFVITIMNFFLAYIDSSNYQTCTLKHVKFLSDQPDISNLRILFAVCKSLSASCSTRKRCFFFSLSLSRSLSLYVFTYPSSIVSVVTQASLMTFSTQGEARQSVEAKRHLGDITGGGSRGPLSLSLRWWY